MGAEGKSINALTASEGKDSGLLFVAGHDDDLMKALFLLKFDFGHVFNRSVVEIQHQFKTTVFVVVFHRIHCEYQGIVQLTGKHH